MSEALSASNSAMQGGGAGVADDGSVAKKSRPKTEWPVLSRDTIHTLKEQRWTLEKIRTILRQDKDVLITLLHKRKIPDADVAVIIGYILDKE